MVVFAGKNPVVCISRLQLVYLFSGHLVLLSFLSLCNINPFNSVFKTAGFFLISLLLYFFLYKLKNFLSKKTKGYYIILVLRNFFLYKFNSNFNLYINDDDKKDELLKLKTELAKLRIKHDDLEIYIRNIGGKDYNAYYIKWLKVITESMAKDDHLLETDDKLLLTYSSEIEHLISQWQLHMCAMRFKAHDQIKPNPTLKPDQMPTLFDIPDDYLLECVKLKENDPSNYIFTKIELEKKIRIMEEKI